MANGQSRRLPWNPPRYRAANPKNPTAAAAGKAKKKEPGQDFSAELAKANQSRQPQTKLSTQGKGPEIREKPRYPEATHLEIVDSRDPNKKRTVEISGSISRANKQGDILDGSMAHAGRVTKTATVTITVTDEAGTTKRTYKGSGVKDTYVHIGNQTSQVNVRGEFENDVHLDRDTKANERGRAFSKGGEDPQVWSLTVDGTSSKFPIGPDREGNIKGLGLSIPTYVGHRADVTYLGSNGSDTVYAVTSGKLTVKTGPGDDWVVAAGGKGSTVQAEGGNDYVYLADQNTLYYGGPGRDVFFGDRKLGKDLRSEDTFGSIDNTE